MKAFFVELTTQQDRAKLVVWRIAYSSVWTFKGKLSDLTYKRHTRQMMQEYKVHTTKLPRTVVRNR